MKKNFRTFAAIALAAGSLLATTSCSKDNNDPVDNTLTDENVLQNDEAAYSLVDAALFQYYYKAFGDSFIVEIFTSKTTSFEGPESAEGPMISRLELEPTNYYFWKRWDFNSQAVALATAAIKQIEASPKVSDQAKKITIGRAKLARALGYHKLVRLFGEVPLYHKDEKSTEPGTIDEIYTQIVQDLKDAAELLPAGSNSLAPSIPTKDAAYALLSRAYLDWGSKPLTYDQVNAIKDSKKDPSTSYDNSRLQLAVEYADKVNATRYALDKDYTKIWGKDNEASIDEKILTFVHDGDAVGTGNHQTHCSFTFGFELEQENHLSPSSDEYYLNWPKGDQRRDVAYIQDAYDNLGDSTAHFVVPYTVPRYGKFVDFTSEGPNQTYKLNDLDRIEIRYSEVLLNKAEALAILGRNAEAATTLNQLRERAFGDKAHNLTSATLDDVKAEWGYEFVYEQKEWFNLTRWKDLIKDLESVKDLEYFKEEYSTVGNKASFHGAGNWGVSEFFAKTYKHLHAKYDHRAGKYYRFLVPTYSDGTDRGIRQNPGY